MKSPLTKTGLFENVSGGRCKGEYKTTSELAIEGAGVGQ